MGESHPTYDEAVQHDVGQILDAQTNGPFLDDFRTFQRRVSHYGLFNSLAQTLLKIASPGVPDTYQGPEIWDFSLVDPDNRRPVDYTRRSRMLQQLQTSLEAAGEDRRELARKLLNMKEDGYIKLYITPLALNCRRTHPGLFSAGDYVLTQAIGARRELVFAFARCHRADGGSPQADRPAAAGGAGSSRICRSGKWRGRIPESSWRVSTRIRAGVISLRVTHHPHGPGGRTLAGHSGGVDALSGGFAGGRRKSLGLNPSVGSGSAVTP